MDISSISVSRTGTYRECPYKYKLRYHEKVPSPLPTPPYFEYGKIVHKIIECYTLSRGKTPIGEIIQSVLNGSICLEPGRVAGKLPQEYLYKLPDHIRRFMTLTEKIGTEGEVELPFDMDLDEPNNAKLIGYIDRLIVNNGEYFIIDYKTSKKGPWLKNQHNITEDLQLKTYSRVIQKKYNVHPSKIRAALYYLDTGALVGANFTEQSLEKTEQELKEQFYAIKNANPDVVVGRPGRHCNFCDYRTICQFFDPSGNR
jgi:putative RecB family exonuclease